MARTLVEVLAQKGEVVHIVSRDASLKAAARLMKSHGVGALVVVENGHPTGILSERDVMLQVVEGRTDANERAVGEAMTVPPLLVQPDVPVEEAVWLMTRCRSRHLIVVSEGELIGLISLGDLARLLVESTARPGVRWARDSEVQETLAEENVRRSS